MVASIEETAERYSIPEAFIGVILLPIVVRTFVIALRFHLIRFSQSNAVSGPQDEIMWSEYPTG